MENTLTNVAVRNEEGLKDFKHRALTEPLLWQKCENEWEGSKNTGKEARPKGFAPKN